VNIIPFGKYKNFADCLAKNQGKKNPEAYCAAIKRQVEGHSLRVSRGLNMDGLCNTKLLALHGVLHQWYKRGRDTWSSDDIKSLHDNVTVVMKTRKLKHNYKCELDDEKESKDISEKEPQEAVLVYDEFEQELLADLEIATLDTRNTELITLESSIVKELGDEIKMPYMFKFAALKEGMFNEVFYPKEQLKAGYKTMKGVDLTIDHGKSVKDVIGKVVDVWWNEELGRIEGVAKIEDTELGRQIAEQVHKGLITGVSVEVLVSYGKSDKGKTAIDPEFVALSLVKTPACKAPDCGIIEKK